MTPAVIALRYGTLMGASKPVSAAAMRHFPPVDTLTRGRTGSYKIRGANGLSAFAPRRRAEAGTGFRCNSPAPPQIPLLIPLHVPL
jgi:hypothetical protein